MNRKSSMYGLMALLLVSSAAVAATNVVETYEVNAQYRGAIKKGFRSIGNGKAAFQQLSANTFRVKAKADANHPDHKRHLALELWQTFRVDGNSVSLVSTEKKWFNKDAAPYE